MVRILCLLLCLLPLLGGCQSKANVNPATVILVRHAEKTDAFGGEPELTPAGRQRSLALVEAVGEFNISAIYATQYLRTQQTVEVLAARLNLPVRIVNVTRDVQAHVDELAAEILTPRSEGSPGGAVLVAGHSNTVPMLIEALGAPPVDPIAEDEYDNLFIVQVEEDGTASVIRARYGD